MKVRGLVTPRRLSEDALAALQRGDVDALMAIEHTEFGNARMMAGESDDDDDDDDDDDTGSAGDGKKTKSSDDDDSGGDDDDDGDDGGDDAERERLRKRMKAADKRASDAERELQKIRDKDKSELERAQGSVADMEKQVETLQSEVSQLRLQNAFLTSNTHSWHDPDTALALASSKGYLEDATDEDGVVDKKALGKALDRLAKEHKYLVKTEEKRNDDDDSGPSGEAAGRRSDNSKDEKAKSAQMRKRFPVLNR